MKAGDNTLNIKEELPKFRDELNLDSSEETDTLLTDLLVQSEAFVQDSLEDTNVDEFSDNDKAMYIRAVYTLATQLYYDRSLENSISKGLQMMLIHLRARGLKDGK